jgi:hypothetical protein
MICENDLDREVARLLGEILGRELSANQRPLADLIGERAGKVAQNADLDRVARNLSQRVRGLTCKRCDGERGAQKQPRQPCTHGRSSDSVHPPNTRWRRTGVYIAMAGPTGQAWQPDALGEARQKAAGKG